MERTRFFRRPVVWFIIVILGAIAASTLFTGGASYKKVDSSRALALLNAGDAKKVLLEDKEQTLSIDLKTKVDGTDKVQAQFPADSFRDIYKQLNDLKAADKLDSWDTKVTRDSVIVGLLVNLLPIAVLVILLLLFMSQMQGGGSRVLNFGKSKAKLISKDTPKTTFSDVAGADEAVEELHEIKDFLQNPAKYQALGAKIPKGVLLFGPPGTLDPALLRPGRFDRQIAVDTPDMEGRKAILRVHAKGKPFTPDVDLDSVARRTPGFTGADLANVVNESALLTARNEKRAITNDFLEEAI